MASVSKYDDDPLLDAGVPVTQQVYLFYILLSLRSDHVYNDMETCFVDLNKKKKKKKKKKEKKKKTGWERF